MPRFNMGVMTNFNLTKKRRKKSMHHKRRNGSSANLLDVGLNTVFLPGGYRMGLRDRAPSIFLPQPSEDERQFFKIITSEDVEEVIDFLQDRPGFNINCQDVQGCTGLIHAIKAEDAETVEYLLSFDEIYLGDTLLHAINTGNLQICEMLLDVQRKCGSEMCIAQNVRSAEFSEDITPLVLAAHSQHYQIIQMLIQRGHTIEKPHPPSCFCEEKCQQKKYGESLSETKARYNAYRALASPAFMAQSSPDPILTAFELSHELNLCAEREREFKTDYLALSEKCSRYAVDLLDQCRSTEEVELVLNQRDGIMITDPANIGQYARISLAVDYDQKNFVAHTNCQQVLRAAWLKDWQDWRGLSFWAKMMRLPLRMFMLPFTALLYWFLPYSKMVKPWRSPINKFFNYASSYILFLILLFVHNKVASENFHRGAPDTGLEWVIILYVLGMAWRCATRIWKHGKERFFKEKWNLYCFFMLGFFIVTFFCWFWAEYDVWENGNRYLPRTHWPQDDPTLIAEGFYAVSIILAFGYVLYFFQIGNHLGPLLISISRMFRDILDFSVIFLIVVFSFAQGLCKLYIYYTDMVRHDPDGLERRQSEAFESLSATFKTQFWALYGYTPPQQADVVIPERVEVVGNQTITIINKHKFTEGMGMILFGAYNVAACIILINLLIAMMSTSYMNVQNNADVEWKFTRTKVWLTFFEHGNTLPPPFNMVPSPMMVWGFFNWVANFCTGADKAYKFSWNRCCYKESPESEREVEEGNYQLLMGQLVQRYLSKQEQKHELQYATISDLDDIKHDIHELKHLLKNSLETEI